MWTSLPTSSRTLVARAVVEEEEGLPPILPAPIHQTKTSESRILTSESRILTSESRILTSETRILTSESRILTSESRILKS